MSCVASRHLLSIFVSYFNSTVSAAPAAHQKLRESTSGPIIVLWLRRPGADVLFASEDPRKEIKAYKNHIKTLIEKLEEVTSTAESYSLP
ncbi:hypothetical protein PILCRDRAFT_830021 [Piloderma croceum F 1598]|uniref:Uncharacterized protein n=1 Tax=Piloderma croceum (strain F 1598) TaxID=765440 RepID=A0A0C3EVI4_PILCF|nr:hypothetical protein PILCRDRAFT_830021 [Piloderma croceum F 1598]